jgi:AraC-like DNA-binding protein
MILAAHIPRSPLHRFVELLWFHEGLDCDHGLERVLPDGSMELIINLQDEPRHVFDRVTHRPRRAYRRSWVSGAHSEFIVIDRVRNASMIGVHFRPGGAHAFFGLPLSELRNQVIDLDTLWNGEANNVRDELLEAKGPDAKFRILEDALLARWHGGETQHRAVRYALDRFTRETESVTIREVTEEIGLSPRHFIEIFSQQVGMTPKVFCRLRRLQRALEKMQKRHVGWADLAADCGYYDQAHFIRDFREFCGVRPTDYVNGQMEYTNFLPIRE